MQPPPMLHYPPPCFSISTHKRRPAERIRPPIKPPADAAAPAPKPKEDHKSVSLLRLRRLLCCHNSSCRKFSLVSRSLHRTISRTFKLLRKLRTFLSKLDELHPGYNADDFFPQGRTSWDSRHFSCCIICKAPIPSYGCIRTIQARHVLVRKWLRPSESVRSSEVDLSIKFLLSRFPVPPAVFSMRYKEIKLLALAILRSKIDYEDHFLPTATHWTNPVRDVTVYKFALQHMPGPERQDNVWYTWMHCSDYIGATGMFSLGRVLPTDVEVAGIASNTDTFSFYGRVCDSPDSEEECSSS